MAESKAENTEESVKESIKVEEETLPSFVYKNDTPISSPNVSADGASESVNDEETPVVQSDESVSNNYQDVEELEELLIKEVQSNRCIWDIKAKTYSHGQTRQQAWLEIARKLGEDEHLLRKKWKNLRDTLIKCLKKRTMIARSGLSGHSKLPNCKFFKELSFLCEILPFPAVTQDLGKPLFSAKHVTPANTVNSANLVSICPPVHTSAQVILKNPCVTSSKVLKRLAPLPTISVYSSPSDVSAKKAFTGYDETPDALFCRSLIPTLKNLSPRSNRLAKMEIQKIMFKYEFGEECST